jgi:DNA-binding LacI/PurR family transcriptional regulator
VASLPALDRRSMLDAVDRFLGQGIEGIIVIATQDTAVAALAHVPPEVPLVAVGCGTRASVTSVAIDNTAGAAAATRYLLGLGHRTVYHVAGPSSCLDAKERVVGWRQVMREAGGPSPPCWPATGPPPRATSWAAGWPPNPGSRPSSAPTTRWRSASSGR